MFVTAKYDAMGNFDRIKATLVADVRGQDKGNVFSHYVTYSFGPRNASMFGNSSAKKKDDDQM